jgi:hypothetical protein
MNAVVKPQVEAFALAVRAFRDWAFSPPQSPEQEAVAAARHISSLIAMACALGVDEGEAADFLKPTEGIEHVEAKAATLPVRYYSEIFNTLVIPAEEAVVGDLIDDLGDIYSDIVPGLDLFDSGRYQDAENHWRFWFLHHWGEHATSALRAIWSHLAGRDGGDAQSVPPNTSFERTRER